MKTHKIDDLKFRDGSTYKERRDMVGFYGKHFTETTRLRDTCKRPRLHPNGFIQLSLNAEDTRRLDVWPDAPISAQKTRHPIHDHTFDIRSRVLCGALTNLTYKFIPHAGCVTTVMHQAKRLPGGQDTVLQEVENNGRGWLICEGGQTNIHTDAYTLHKDVLHDSIPHGLTATIMERSNINTYGPLIAVPFGVVPDNDFRRETVDEDLLWDFIDKAVRRSVGLQTWDLTLEVQNSLTTTL